MSAVIYYRTLCHLLRISSSNLSNANGAANGGWEAYVTKLVPIEVDTGARNVRFNREMVFDRKRTRRILIDRKAMDLEPAGVRLSGHQADM